MTSPAKSKSVKWLGRLLFALACLVTMFVLFCAEENWRGERAWNTYKHELEAKGVKLDWTAFIPPPVPDDQNFAMTPFFAPFQNFDPATGKLRETDALKWAQGFAKSLPSVKSNGWRDGQCVDLVALRDAMQKPPGKEPATAKSQFRTAQERSAAAPSVLAALKPYEPVIEELRTASRRPHCRFNLNYATENPAAIILPHIAPLRNVCRILTLRASAELAAGHPEQAMADLELLFYMAGTTKNDFLIGHLVAVSILDMATQIAWEGLVSRQWSDAQLQSLQERFQNTDCLAGAWNALQAERAGFGSAMFDYLKKMPRKKLLSMLQISGGDPSLEPTGGSLISAMIPTGWLDLEQVSYHRLFEEQLVPVFDMPNRRVYPQRSKQSESVFAKSGISCIWQHQVLSRLMLPAIASIARKSAQAQTTMDEAALACAMERCRLAGGKFLDSLDALALRFVVKLPHDIITGEPLKYRRDGDGYILYSVGWNEKDNGGVPDAKGDNAQGDWVWQCPAKK